MAGTAPEHQGRSQTLGSAAAQPGQDEARCTSQRDGSQGPRRHAGAHFLHRDVALGLGQVGRGVGAFAQGVIGGATSPARGGGGIRRDVRGLTGHVVDAHASHGTDLLIVSGIGMMV
ncbi:hypothetical protein AZA_01934 [Nitrospirillum viridazoti Y2]|nr:hypothetical protein AZA_01934 [Nitrospirillum amazonense Y2]